nr:MAG TPA: hypothetical protein [Caudoviricetes sp.]
MTLHITCSEYLLSSRLKDEYFVLYLYITYRSQVYNI